MTRRHNVTLSAGHDQLLRPARELGFTVPVEAAVHVHVDGAPYRSVAAFSNLVRLFGHWREALRVALGTNPACTRLQPLPAALIALVEHQDAVGSNVGTGSNTNVGSNVGTDTHADEAERWTRLQEAAKATGLTKYFDVNLTALLADRPPRDTVEVRILPGSLQADEIVRRAAFVEALLARCREPAPFPRPTAADPAATAAELRALVGFIPSTEVAQTQVAIA